ncbi:Low-temperature-induced 65 kDa protein [Ananas comosus]|uniref:Low-temperature-induced 65 kDa protein n=1 Tax=Ananas comosus TaxID=4615 RepID=A0A199UJ70_ANACO|nr:Low-temperature-induced 65 kDa protein [Ananas comosus]
MQEVRPVDIHSAIEGEDEHHEKKPVTMKVKEKVKKLKNTVTKKIRGGDDQDQGHDYEHQRDHDRDMDEEEEEEEEEGGYQEDDEDKLVDPEPEVHGAPTYDTATVPAAVTGREETEHEKVRARESEEPEKVRLGDVAGSTVEDPAAPHSSTPPPRGTFYVVRLYLSRQSYNPSRPCRSPTNPKARTGQEDQFSPEKPSKRGYEEEHDVKLEDRLEAAAPTAPTGSHDQFSPEEPSKQAAAEKQENPQSYTEKLKSAAAGTTEYGKKIASAAYDKAAGVGATAYDKASGAGAAVMAKVQQPQGGGGAAATTGEEGSGNRDKGVSMRDYIAEKLKPGDEHKALSEVISDAMPTRKGERKGEIEHKASEEVISGSEERSRGEEIERKAGEEVIPGGETERKAGEEVIPGGETKRKAGEEVIAGGETEQKAGEEGVIGGGGETEQKAGEEVTGSTISDERRGGVTMMEKIRGAVTSLIGSNGTSSKSPKSPKSPASDAKEKGANANVVEGTKQESEVR